MRVLAAACGVRLCGIRLKVRTLEANQMLKRSVPPRNVIGGIFVASESALCFIPTIRLDRPKRWRLIGFY